MMGIYPYSHTLSNFHQIMHKIRTSGSQNASKDLPNIRMNDGQTN